MKLKSGLDFSKNIIEYTKLQREYNDILTVTWHIYFAESTVLVSHFLIEILPSLKISPAIFGPSTKPNILFFFQNFETQDEDGFFAINSWIPVKGTLLQFVLLIRGTSQESHNSRHVSLRHR